MKKTSCLAVVVCIGIAAVGEVRANSWCESLVEYGITPVFCDDFDEYCTNPDPEIDQCPRDGTAIRSDYRMRLKWPRTSINTHLTWEDSCPPIDPNASEMALEDDQAYLVSAPFGGRNVNNGISAGHVGQATADIVPGIKAKFGEQYDQILGTDEVPLVLQFTMNAGIKDAGALFRSVGYLEVGFESGTCVPKQPNGGDLDPEVTPTDWIPVGVEEDPVNNPGCISCYHMCPAPNYSVHVWWPTICQSYNARTASPACPPVPETKIHTTLAVGAIAWLDPDPCHCDLESKSPQNYHLVFFDGWKWRTLKQGMFLGSGDFNLGQQTDWVTMTIKTNTVDIQHESRQWLGTAYGPWVTSTAYGIPRKYLGGFNVLRSGTASGCKLRNDVYSCEQWGSTMAKRTSEGERCDFGTPLHEPDGSKFVSIDNVALLDGIPDINYTIGACCLDDGSCVETNLSTCETDLGGRYQNAGTFCDTTACCPYPFADADHDGDVDQDDFGALQVCYTGTGGGVPTGCECFDRVSSTPEGIDGADFTQFSNCWTGPNVPFDENNPGSCLP